MATMRPAGVGAAILRPAVYTPQSYGAIADGVADDSDAISDAIQAAYDAGGGVVHFARGTYLCASAITMPDTGSATVPQTVPITLQGVGPQWTGRNSITTSGGSVLNITATDTYGKLKTKGIGWLGIKGLTFTDTAGTTTPFVYTTNTTLHVSECAFIGTKTTTACDQDAIICGGTIAHETDPAGDDGGGWNDGFQGYGTLIKDNYFNRIRRAVYGRTYFNGNVIRDNIIWAQSGNSTGGAIVLNGSAVSGSSYAVGNVISGNLIEMVGYDYGIELEWAFSNSLSANNFFDGAANTLADIHFGANTLANTAWSGYAANGFIDLGSRNTILQSEQGVSSKLTPFTVDDANYFTTLARLKVDGGGDDFLVQPAAAASEATDLFVIRRSAAEATNASANIYQIRQRGDQVVRGAQAGNITYQDADGSDLTTFTGSGRTWNAAGTGGNMKINSGTGGSYLTLQNYGVKLADQAGANIVTIRQAAGTPEGNFAANVGSLFLRTDGGAGTCLYVKESGTGNTGWKAVTTS